ncbi:uncharacterized protein LOC141835571 [Curcuma longa]|uniref:uncharacterized protein LOC141835571 n=1 Tax=Curcuma longa TaxID=136217 RepID=UPI003D9E93DB
MMSADGEVIDCVDIYKQPALDHPLLKDHKIQQSGAIQIGGPYIGAKAEINVWNIPVEPNEWSHSAIEISDAVNYYVEAGWTEDGYGKTGCFNLLCPGFVQVSKKFAPGLILTPLSSYNGAQFAVSVSVYKDEKEWNWWVVVKGEPVGYWPAKLFGGEGVKFQEAKQVKWVGSVLNTRNQGHHTTTHMGSGFFAEEGWAKAANFGSVYILTPSNNLVPQAGNGGPRARLFATANHCYSVLPGRGSVCNWNTTDLMDRTQVVFIFLKSITLWFLFLVSISCTVVVKGQSDHELEAHLKRLNKPAVKTMTTTDGEVIDCVDIYKQPAFDHPLLKDHKIQQAGAWKTGGPYIGAKASINVWNIPVEPDEWSHSAIEISDAVNYYIEAGWTVNPELFGDKKTHLYAFWTADGYGKTGCYNLLCPGFVQVSKSFALGIIAQPVSSYNGSQFVIETTVYKEATQVKFVGSVLNKWKEGHHTTTHMGSGFMAEEGWGKAAYFQSIGILPPSNTSVPQNLEVRLFATANRCYSVMPASNSNPLVFFYGGPGGPNCA